jgi:hypothetical protein
VPVPARVGGIPALLAFLTFTSCSIAGGLAQPDVYSFSNDDLSDLTANLSGLFAALVGLALWRALSPDIPLVARARAQDRVEHQRGAPPSDGE